MLGLAALAQGDDHATGGLELSDERRRRFFRRRGYDDAVEGRLRRPPQPAVADDGGHIGNTERSQTALGRLLQLAPALDGVDAAAEMREHGGLITRARADLQHLVALVELESFRHESDDKGLRDGLTASDGKRLVAIGVIGPFGIDEEIARDPLDGAQHIIVADAATPELHDQTDLVLGGYHGRSNSRWRSQR